MKRFEIFKNILYLLIADHSFQIYCSVCIVFIVSICVSFLYICLTSETLHYPWIPSWDTLYMLNIWRDTASLGSNMF